MNNLQKIRKERGLTRKALSVISGIPEKSLENLEYGRRAIDGTKLDTLCSLAIALDVSIYDLLESENLKEKFKITLKNK